jgi:hypothetical protein
MDSINNMRPDRLVTSVLVLYKTKLEESRTFVSLKPQLGFSNLVVYDNSPEACIVQDETVPYKHDPSNGGLTAAYAWAAALATEAGSEWLLLLDQDSNLPANYLQTFYDYVPYFASETVAAIPTVYSGGEIVSPRLVTAGIPGIGCLPQTSQGVQRREITGINSGCFVRLSYLRSIGGFISRNKLDGVDRFFFDSVHKDGCNVFLLPQTLDHQLSISDVGSISPDRWRSIVESETDFFQKTRPRSVRALQSALMFWRAISPITRLPSESRKLTLTESRRLFSTLFR